MELPLAMDNFCRKRSRNANEDETSEFTPLSKRINNLHLNTFPIQKPMIDCEPKGEAHKDLVAANERLSSLQYDCSRGVDDPPQIPSSHAHQWPAYTPDLTPNQNPIYYEPNRLLFELFQQRIQRQSSSPPF